MMPNLLAEGRSGRDGGRDDVPGVLIFSAARRSKKINIGDAGNVVPSRTPCVFILLTVMMIFGLSARSFATGPSKDSIWSGVILATKVSESKPAPRELASIEAQLKTIFGYNHFELLGEHLEQIDEPDERWLIPNTVICLRVRAWHVSGKSYRLKLELFQRTKMLAAFDAKVDASCPLVIRGPLNGKGQLLFILRVQ